VKLTVKSGALIPVLLMLPNVVWMLFYNRSADASASPHLALYIAENTGRVAVLLLPFFYALNLKKPYALVAMVGMAIALAVYYGAWARFFAGGGLPALLGAPLWGIPGPLALAPVVVLMLSAYLMSSWLMLSAAVFFGVLHVWSSSMAL
jgi:hypothetical protein